MGHLEMAAQHLVDNELHSLHLCWEYIWRGRRGMEQPQTRTPIPEGRLSFQPHRKHSGGMTSFQVQQGKRSTGLEHLSLPEAACPSCELPFLLRSHSWTPAFRTFPSSGPSVLHTRMPTSHLCTVGAAHQSSQGWAEVPLGGGSGGAKFPAVPGPMCSPF